MLSFKHWKTRPFFRLTTYSVLLAFGLNILGPLPKTYAQILPELGLPNPGMMIGPSPAFVPVILRGIKVHPDNPFQFDFIVDTGNEFPPSLTLPTDGGGNSKLQQESTKLIKYFLASLTVPEDDLWVNLSPYEKDRIIPEAFGQTEMGRDLLSQDYILKQLTASLLYPENDLGKTFWDRVYKKTQEQYGTSEIPINTFNKVWIVPDKAEVYETEDTAFVTESHLKVMLEGDYLALQNNLNQEEIGTDQLDSQDVEALSDVSSQIVKEIILPAIEVEVNEGKNFAQLRQIYNSLILAAWFKRALKESILNKVYTDQNKITGVDIEDKEAKQKIYQQYLEAFKKGVYDYIKEDYDPASQEIIPRRYFSGGFDGPAIGEALHITEGSKEHPAATLRAWKKVAGLITGLAILAQVNFAIASPREMHKTPVATSEQINMPKKQRLIHFIRDSFDKIPQESADYARFKVGDFVSPLSSIDSYLGKEIRKILQAIITYNTAYDTTDKNFWENINSLADDINEYLLPRYGIFIVVGQKNASTNGFITMDAYDIEYTIPVTLEGQVFTIWVGNPIDGEDIIPEMAGGVARVNNLFSWISKARVESLASEKEPPIDNPRLKEALANLMNKIGEFPLARVIELGAIHEADHLLLGSSYDSLNDKRNSVIDDEISAYLAPMISDGRFVLWALYRLAAGIAGREFKEDISIIWVHILRYLITEAYEKHLINTQLSEIKTLDDVADALSLLSNLTTDQISWLAGIVQQKHCRPGYPSPVIPSPEGTIFFTTTLGLLKWVLTSWRHKKGFVNDALRTSIVFGQAGSRVTDPKRNRLYGDVGGWEIRLKVEEEYLKAMDEWLFKNYKGRYDLSEEGVFTVHIGDKTLADRLASKIEKLARTMGHLLLTDPPGLWRPLTEHISGRFNPSRTFREEMGFGDAWFNGIPLDMEALSSLGGNPNPEAIQQEWERIKSKLAQKFGPYFMGSKKADPGSGQAVGQNGQAKVKADQAALSQQNPGGIDVRKTEDVLKTKGQGVRFDVPSNFQNLDPNSPYLQDLPGLTPVIFQMNVIPLQQLPGILLGIKEEGKRGEFSATMLWRIRYALERRVC